MSKKETLIGLGAMIGVGIFAVLSIIWVMGWAMIAANFYRMFSVLVGIASALAIPILILLAIPRATRKFSVIGLGVFSYIFRVMAWMEGFLLLFPFLAMFAVSIGLLSPVTVIDILIQTRWNHLLNFVVFVVLKFVCILVAWGLAYTLDRKSGQKNLDAKGSSLLLTFSDIVRYTCVRVTAPAH